MPTPKDPVIAPENDRLLSFATLGERWDCHPKVAKLRAKALGLQMVRWNKRTVCVRLSEVLKAEAEASV